MLHHGLALLFISSVGLCLGEDLSAFIIFTDRRFTNSVHYLSGVLSGVLDIGQGVTLAVKKSVHSFSPQLLETS